MRNITLLFKDKKIKLKIFNKTDERLVLIINNYDYNQYIKGVENEFYENLCTKLGIKNRGKTHFENNDKSHKNERLLFVDITN